MYVLGADMLIACVAVFAFVHTFIQAHMKHVFWVCESKLIKLTAQDQY